MTRPDLVIRTLRAALVELAAPTPSRSTLQSYLEIAIHFTQGILNEPRLLVCLDDSAGRPDPALGAGELQAGREPGSADLAEPTLSILPDPPADASPTVLAVAARLAARKSTRTPISPVDTPPPTK